jgi:hypothetical protein
MKRIVLHGPAIDGAGNFCDAGTELEIAAKAKEGQVLAEDAKALVDGGRAVSATAAAEIEKAAQEPGGA